MNYNLRAAKFVRRTVPETFDNVCDLAIKQLKRNRQQYRRKWNHFMIAAARAQTISNGLQEGTNVW